jgi:hypothetical protein
MRKDNYSFNLPKQNWPNHICFEIFIYFSGYSWNEEKLLFWSNLIAVINQPRLHGLPFFLLITENQHWYLNGVCVCVCEGDKRDP